ncbi:hypothetical protein BGZ82_008916 [Podila clonocystis]|nr:hypothetical protein BGZ82_008916 [Podila clonocystis]
MLALWIESTSATLVCTSPTRLTNGIRAGSSIVLGFSDALSSASDITAQLICSANGSVALTLGSGYDSTNYSPNSPTINITEAQVSAAIQACPSNSFHVQYVGSALLGRDMATCAGDTNISLAAAPKIESLIPPLRSGEPSATPSSNPHTTNVPTASPIVPTTDAPAPPPSHTTTIPPVTSDPVVPTSTEPVVPPVVPPVTTTTTNAHTTTSAKPITSKGSGNGSGNGGNGSGSNKPVPSTSPTTSGTSEASDMQHETSSSTSTSTIAGACAGVVGGVCAILAGLLVWRKRQQKKMKFDQFYDDSLAAASGFGAKPIYGREEPDEEQGSGPGVGAVVPLTQAHHRSLSTKNSPSQAGSPPPLVPVTPTPAYDNGYHYEDAQDTYYNDQYHTYQPYQLPYHQPYQQAYSQNPQEYYDYSYEMQPTDHSQDANDAHEGKVPVSEGAVGYYPQGEYGREYKYEDHDANATQHKTR